MVVARRIISEYCLCLLAALDIPCSSSQSANTKRRCQATGSRQISRMNCQYILSPRKARPWTGAYAAKASPLWCHASTRIIPGYNATNPQAPRLMAFFVSDIQEYLQRGNFCTAHVVNRLNASGSPGTRTLLGRLKVCCIASMLASPPSV
jgi:hypothetical protein